MIIDSLIYKTGVDLSGLGKDLRRVDATVGRSLDSIGADLKRLKMPSFDVAMPKGIADMKPPALDSGDMMTGVALIRGGIAGMGSDLKRSLAPLNAFAADFASKFDRIGPIIEKLAIRIDDAMRFPQFEKRIEKARTAILKPFGMLPGMIGKQFATVGDRVGSALDFAVGKAKSGMDRLKATIDSYDLGASTHVSPVMPYKATRTRKNNRFTGTAPGGSVQAAPTTMGATAAPTAGIKGMVAKVASDPGWSNLAAAGKKTGAALADAFRGVAGPLAFVGRGTAIFSSNLLGAWASIARGRSALSTLGSIANSTWGALSKIKAPKLSFDPKQSIVLKGIGAAARGVGGAFTAMLGPLAPILSIFGAVTAIGGFFKAGIVGATGLNETLSKTDAVLGPASAGVKSYADNVSKQFGLVKQETLDAAAGFGGMFKNQGGLGGKALEEQTIKLTQAAADLKSFSHISFEDASRSLQTALIGNESDALRKLGIDYSADAVKAHAYATGVAKVGSELTSQQELMVRSKIIMAGLGDTQGDLARTAGSSANMYANVTGSLTNLANSIGSALMPAIDRGLAGLSSFVGMLSTAFESGKAVFDSFVDRLAIGFDFVAAVVTHPAAAFQVLKLKATEVFANILEWAVAVGAYMPTLTAYIGRNWQALLTDLAINTLTACENIGKNFAAVGEALGKFMANPMGGFPAVNWSPLTDGFLHTAEALPGMIRPVLTDLSKEINQAGKPIWDDFEKRRAEAMKGAAPFAERKGDALTALDPAKKEKKGKAPDQFAEAAVVGTAEAVKSLNRAQYGMKAGNPNKTLEVQGRQSLENERIANQVGKQTADGISAMLTEMRKRKERPI